MPSLQAGCPVCAKWASPTASPSFQTWLEENLGTRSQLRQIIIETMAGKNKSSSSWIWRGNKIGTFVNCKGSLCNKARLRPKKTLDEAVHFSSSAHSSPPLFVDVDAEQMATETVLAGELPGVKLVSSTGATSEVYKHGAHVASWKTGQGDDIIFLSSEVRFFFTPSRNRSSPVPSSFELHTRRVTFHMPIHVHTIECLYLPTSSFSRLEYFTFTRLWEQTHPHVLSGVRRSRVSFWQTFFFQPR